MVINKQVMREPSLTWNLQHELNNLMEEHYQEIIGYCHLVDSWKIECSKGTTLECVYRDKDKYKLCTFSPGGESKVESVYPRFEHTGWDTI